MIFDSRWKTRIYQAARWSTNKWLLEYELAFYNRTFYQLKIIPFYQISVSTYQSCAQKVWGSLVVLTYPVIQYKVLVVLIGLWGCTLQYLVSKPFLSKYKEYSLITVLSLTNLFVVLSWWFSLTSYSSSQYFDRIRKGKIALHWKVNSCSGFMWFPCLYYVFPPSKLPVDLLCPHQIYLPAVLLQYCSHSVLESMVIIIWLESW